MKTQDTRHLTYIAPETTAFLALTRIKILQGSPVNQWQEGSHTEDDMNEMENGGW